MFSCVGESINIGLTPWENNNSDENAEVAESFQISSDSESDIDLMSTPSITRQDLILDAGGVSDWDGIDLYANPYDSLFTTSDQDVNPPLFGLIPDIALLSSPLDGEEVQPLFPAENSEFLNVPSELPSELPSEQPYQGVQATLQQLLLESQRERRRRRFLIIKAKRANGSISPRNSRRKDTARSSRAKGQQRENGRFSSK